MTRLPASLAAALVLLLPAGIDALSLIPGEASVGRPSQSASDRRGFLARSANKVAAVAFGASGVPAEGARAAAPVYEPPPGSQADRVHVVTGASTGLGLESAKRLAAAGATVVMTARSDAKGSRAKDAVREYLRDRSVANDRVFVLPLDLSDLSSVRSFPERYGGALGSRKIDVLMNNAGAKNNQRELTEDGLERTFQSNHVGPFLLTALLFPHLNRDGSRIINVSSTAHALARVEGRPGLDLNNLNSELSYGLGGWEAYGQTKLENILFTQELQRRADAAGLTWLSAVALHPGVVGTDIWRNSYVAKSNSVSLQALASKLFYGSVLSTEEGANTQVMLAAEEVVSKGKYYDEFGKVKELAPFAQDAGKARELWEISERLSGCKFNVE